MPRLNLKGSRREQQEEDQVLESGGPAKVRASRHSP
jgi:hypothetical protein